MPAAQLQSPPKIARAAVLRAMVVLKIAPYLRGAAPKVKQPYRIAVVGKGDVATAMIKRLPNKAVRKRRVEVLALDAAKLLGETAPAFDLVFVAKSVKQEHVARILAKFQQMPTPLVCERPGFAAAGGGIQLFVKNNALRFEINATALKEQGVRASPQVLKLSKRGPRK